MDVRRLPVYLLVDCSGSMAGEPIMAMEMGVRALVADLHADPYALDTVWLSVIAFGSTADQVLPLTEVGAVDLPPLDASGTTALGEALDLLLDRLRAEVRRTTADQKGDWRPMVFLFTDGEPTGSWRPALARLHAEYPVTMVVCGAGPEVNDATLKEFGGTVVRLHDTQPGTLGAFMKWVTVSVSTASKSLGARDTATPELPPFPEPEAANAAGLPPLSGGTNG